MTTSRKDELGNTYFKIVFYGPSKSGKTTALKWLHQDAGFKKGVFITVDGPDGQTTYFDHCTLWKDRKIIFGVFTSAGGEKFAKRRRMVLRGVDGILFMCDSDPLSITNNFLSLQELPENVGRGLGKTIPLVIALNKRDVYGALPRESLITALRLEEYEVFETVATIGHGVLGAFNALIREVIIKRPLVVELSKSQQRTE